MVEQLNEPVAGNEFDLAIIGGGIIGMCTAWYAARQFPLWRIAVFEQNETGSGATHYSASLDLPYGHTPMRHQMAKRSGELYKALRKTLLLPIKDIPFYGITDYNNAEKMITNFVDESLAISPKKMDAVAATYPGLIIPDGKTIIAKGMASYAMQNKVAKILGENFSDHHHAIFEHTAIQSIELTGHRYRLLTATGQRFSAKKVVQATGPWLHTIWAGGSLPSQNLRVKKIVAFHIMQQPEPDDALFYFFDDDAFLLPEYEAGYWLFSFKCDHWDVLPDKNNLRIDEADITKARSILKKYYPSFEPLCNEGRVFCDTYTETGDPLIEPLCKDQTYMYAGAGAGSGYRLAPAIAEAAIHYFVKPV